MIRCQNLSKSFRRARALDGIDRRRFLGLFALTPIAAALAACGDKGGWPDAQAQGSAPLFEASLRDIDNRRVALADFRGQPLIVTFWARWCASCRAEIPELNAIRQSHGPQGLHVIGIGLEDNSPTVKDFIKAYEMEYLLLFAPVEGLSLMRALGNGRAGLPFTLAVDRQGRVVMRKLGQATRADLEQAAAAALK